MARFQRWHARTMASNVPIGMSWQTTKAIHPHMKYSKNPIINRFLQLTIEEGKSVRCLELGHCPNSTKTVRFRLGDGTDCQFVDDQDSRTFMKSWQDASDFVKRLRHVDLSPAL